jgi:hypothetical protein
MIQFTADQLLEELIANCHKPYYPGHSMKPEKKILTAEEKQAFVEKMKKGREAKRAEREQAKAKAEASAPVLQSHPFQLLYKVRVAVHPCIFGHPQYHHGSSPARVHSPGHPCMLPCAHSPALSRSHAHGLFILRHGEY